MRKIDELDSKKQKLPLDQELDCELSREEVAALDQIGELAREMKVLNAQIRQYLEEHPYVNK